MWINRNFSLLVYAEKGFDIIFDEFLFHKFFVDHLIRKFIFFVDLTQNLL